jgi:hypothetical protein
MSGPTLSCLLFKTAGPKTLPAGTGVLNAVSILLAAMIMLMMTTTTTTTTTTMMMMMMMMVVMHAVRLEHPDLQLRTWQSSCGRGSHMCRQCLRCPVAEEVTRWIVYCSSSRHAHKLYFNTLYRNAEACMYAT